MRAARRVLCASAVTFGLLAAPGLVRADEPTPEVTEPGRGDQRARAQQLFDSALTDAEAGNFAAACPKFLASQEADPKTSTLLNLANCYEKNGQTASAWGAFREAEVLARKIGRADWESSSRTRAEALEPQLVRLSIIVSEAHRAPGLVVTRDGARLAPGEWGVAIPVDPGEHVVTASATGRASWETRIPVRESRVTVDVPALALLPQPPPPVVPPPIAPPHRAGWSTLETTGAIVAGVGVVGVVAGGLVGLVAQGDYNDARARCRDGARGCPAGAVSDADAAYGVATGATVIFVAGAVLLAGGATLFVLAPNEKSAPRGAGAKPTTRVALTPAGLAATW